MVSCARSSSTVLTTFSRMSGVRVFSRSMPSACWVESTTVSSRTGVVPSYWTVTCVLPSGRR